MAEPIDMEKEIRSILASRKYAGLMVPEETLRDLLHQELQKFNKPADAVKSARQKLHNIVAPYLGDLNYGECRQVLQAIRERKDPVEIADFCTRLLRQHHSTRERLPYMQEFYACIQTLAGQPAAIWTWLAA